MQKADSGKDQTQPAKQLNATTAAPTTSAPAALITLASKPSKRFAPSKVAYGMAMAPTALQCNAMTNQRSARAASTAGA
jgi:hypothetical protein